MIKKYRKLPIVVEAVQWEGGNYTEVLKFSKLRDCFLNEIGDLYIETLEGAHKAKLGDMIIKGIEGETYPCDEAIFHKTYKEVK